MKKLYLFFLIVLNGTIFSQSYNYYHNSWRLGMNMGGMWQTSDISSNPAGFGGGITLERGIFENEKHFFSFAIRGRFLLGNTYGYNGKKNYNLNANPTYNGTYNYSSNYTNDTIAANRFVYNNYKTGIGEGALELQISFNRLRERTHIILNLWGGIGVSAYRARVNALNGTSLYGFSKVDSTGDVNNAVLSQKGILDKSYESFGQGSKNGSIWTISPSAGIGLGYQFGKAFSMILEYKVTFPKGINADLLDGLSGPNSRPFGKNNDYYHYLGINFLFTLAGGGGHSSNTHYTQAETHTVVPPPSNTVSPIDQYASVQPPQVTITNPSYSPYSVNSSNFTIRAKVYHVATRNQLNIVYDGMQITNYTFNGTDISFPVSLVPGNNNVSITATNSGGSDSKSATIIYQGNPPIITVTNPASNPYSTTNPLVDINANILNISSSNDVIVKLNGNYIGNFSYDTPSTQFQNQVSLLLGNNYYEITATNQFGKDVKTLTLIYTKPIDVGGTLIPVTVVITDPSVNPYTTKLNPYPVKAKVTGVTSFTQVSVTVNGAGTNFNMDNNGIVTFNAPLNAGNNYISVSAKKGKSSDSKSTVILLDAEKKKLPPTVIITNPGVSPYTTKENNFDFKAQTTNISFSNQLEVKFNGAQVYNYNFNSNGSLDFSTGLIANSNNVFEVKATNNDGSSAASAIVVCNQVMGTGLDIKTKVICYKKDKMNYETITIKETEWPAYQAKGAYEGPCKSSGDNGGNFDPTITICHKNSDGSKQTMNILQSQWASHQAHGDDMGACPKVENSGGGNFDPIITICHKNGDGSKQTMNINQSQWASHQAHGDDMGACPKVENSGGGNFDPTITICHKNSDGSKQTMNILQSQWASHQAHGDDMGACPKLEDSGGGNFDPQITICHKNSDGSTQTMNILQSQWASHQAHGDIMGACSRGDGGGNTDLEITICHHEGSGPPQTITIYQSQWPQHQAHGDTQGPCPTSGGSGENQTMISICHRNNDGTWTPMTIMQSQLLSHQAHGDHTGNCTASELDPNISICHKNNDGTYQNMTIPQSQWSSHQSHGDHMGSCTSSELDPNISICHIPPGNNQNPQNITIPMSAWPAHQAHGDHMGSCTASELDPNISICHIPPGNNQNPQNITIPMSAWPAHQAHGDHMGSCTASELDPNISICHKNNNGTYQNMTIPQSQWASHQSHGDHMGSCTNDELDPKMTICHIPPGNNQNPQTITISVNAWPAHQAHGDTQGPCPPQNKTLKGDDQQLDAPKNNNLNQMQMEQPKKQEELRPNNQEQTGRPNKTLQQDGGGVNPNVNDGGKVLRPR